MKNIYEKIMEFKNKYSGTIAFRLDKHASVLENYINSDEEVLYAFCAQINAEWYDICSSCAIVLTNKRLLVGKKRLLWGSSYMQVTPEMYNDMEIYEGLLFGSITIDTVKEKIYLSKISNKALDEIETYISRFMMEAKNELPKGESEE